MQPGNVLGRNLCPVSEQQGHSHVQMRKVSHDHSTVTDPKERLTHSAETQASLGVHRTPRSQRPVKGQLGPVLSARRKVTVSPKVNPFEDSNGLRALRNSTLNACCAFGVISACSCEKSDNRNRFKSVLEFGKVQENPLLDIFTFLKPARCI